VDHAEPLPVGRIDGRRPSRRQRLRHVHLVSAPRGDVGGSRHMRRPSGWFRRRSTPRPAETHCHVAAAHT
jgi:hypothetical protein